MYRFKQFCEDNAIKCLNSTGYYYGDCLYRVQTSLSEFSTHPLAETRTFQSKHHKPWTTLVLNRVFDHISKTYSSKRRVGSGFCSHYFRTEDDALRFLTDFRPQVIEANCPRNHDDIKHFESTEYKPVVRPRLFWNKFRYCVWFRHQDRDITSEIDQSMIDLVSSLNAQDEDRGYYTQAGSIRKVYLRDQEDIILVQVQYLGSISRIEKVVLQEEIDSEYQAS